MASLGNLVVNIGANTSGFTRGMNAVANVMNSSKLRKGGTPGAGIIGGMKGSLTGSIVKANLLTAALSRSYDMMKGLVSQSVILAANTESTKLTFEVLTGSKDIGHALFGEMENIAKRTTLTLEDTTSAARQLLVGFDANQIPELVTMLGDISSGMDNVSLQEMAFLLQTSAEEGKLLARDLRQFTTRGIPLPGALKEVMGLVGPGSGAKLNELVSAGQVTMDKTMKALKLLSNTKYKDMLERQGRTLKGRFTQLIDAWSFTLRDIGTMIVDAFDIKGAIENATNNIRRLQEQLWKLKPSIELIGVTFWKVIGAARKMVDSLLQMFPSIDTMKNDIQELFTVITASIGFAADEWSGLIKSAFLEIRLELVKLGEDFKHFFTVSAPAQVKWFAGGKWLDNVKAKADAAKKGVAQYAIDMGDYLAHVLATGTLPGPKPVVFKDFNKGMKPGGNNMPAVPPRQKSELEKQLEQDAAKARKDLGKKLTDTIADALAKLAANRKPPVPPGLGPSSPFRFDNGMGGDDDSKVKTGLMQGTQEAWTAIMGAMEKDPVVEAVTRQTRQQRTDAENIRRAINEANQDLMAFGGMVLPGFP